jgi:ABC-2 type transport system permease protein
MLADRVPVLAAVLRERRRSLVLWSVAVGAISAMYVSFWPAMGEAGEMEAFIDNMPEQLVTALGYDVISTPSGYLESTVFGLLAPILLLVLAIGAGARLVGGEEEDGTLELELAHPVARRRVVAERALALVLMLVTTVAVVAAVTVLLVATLDMDVATMDVVATSTGLLLLVVGFGLLALAVGAATGRRGIALGVSAGLAVIAYVADAVAPLVEWGGALRAASPFSWYLGADPLTTGWDPGGLAALVALSVVAVGLALATFDRRDLLV